MNSGSSASRMTVDDSIDASCAVVAPAAELAGGLAVRLAVGPSSPSNHDMGRVHSLADAKEEGYASAVPRGAQWMSDGLARLGA
jgi:hypothetical protein